MIVIQKVVNHGITTYWQKQVVKPTTYIQNKIETKSIRKKYLCNDYIDIWQMSYNIVNIIMLATIEDGIKKKCSISVFSRFYCYQKHK